MAKHITPTDVPPQNELLNVDLAIVVFGVLVIVGFWIVYWYVRKTKPEDKLQ